MTNGEVMFRHFFREQITEAHPAGFELAYQPAVVDRARSWWYATEADAMAALAEIASQYPGRTLTNDGRYLDVTSPGCAESRYFVRPTPGSDGFRIQS